LSKERKHGKESQGREEPRGRVEGREVKKRVKRKGGSGRGGGKSCVMAVRGMDASAYTE